MRGGCVLLAVLSLSLSACGSASSSKPVTVDTNPSSLGAILIAQDSVSIAEYCLHAAGARDARQLPATAKERLYEQRALQSLQIEAKTHPQQTYRGVALRDEMLKLAKLLEAGRCDPAGARLLRGLARSIP